MNKIQKGVYIINISTYIKSKQNMVLCGSEYGQELKERIERDSDKFINLLEKYDKVEFVFNGNIKHIVPGFFRGLFSDLLSYLDKDTFLSRIVFESENFNIETFKNKHYIV